MTQLNSKFTAIAFALSVSFAASANQHGSMNQDGEMGQGEMQQNGSMQGGGMQSMGTHCSLKLNADQFILQTLPQVVIDDLLFMREEEKLARDVYQELYKRWINTSGVMVFGNIASSEQMHMDRIKIFLDAYDLTDSASEVEGEFNNNALQALYNDLVEKGSVSELEAYKVGALVEEVDIKDLITSIENTEVVELKKMYTDLLNASHKHLRAFSKKIVALEGDYIAQVMSQEAVDEILNAPNMMMAMGNGIRVTSAGEMGTNACFVSSLEANEQALQNGSSINPDQKITIAYHVDVDANDVGKAADWVIVANYMPSEDALASWFVRDGGQWQVWDGQLENLSAAMSSDELQTMQIVPVFDGVLSSLPGKYTIYAGYRTDDNDLVYNPSPLMFSVKP